MRTLIRFYVGLVYLFLCLGAQASGLIIGPLCLDGVKAISHPENSTRTATGVWTPNEYRLNDETNPRIVVFSAPVAEVEQLESCAQTQTRLEALGVKPILAGRIKALKLKTSLFTGNQGNRVQVNDGDFSATLSAVDNGEHSIAGGTVSFKGSHAWIGNTSTILSKVDGIEGELSIETWNRTIQKAVVAIPGGTTYTVNLKPKDEGNFTVRLDLKTGSASLWDGDIEGKPTLEQEGDWRLGIIEGDAVKANANSLRLMVSNGAVEATFGSISGSATAIRVPTKAISWQLQQPQFQVDKLIGNASQASSGLLLTSASLKAAKISSKSATVTASGKPLIDGEVQLDASKLNSSVFQARATWEKPHSLALSPIFSDTSIQRIVLNIDGGRDTPSAALQVDTTGLMVGGVHIEHPLRFDSTAAPVTLEIVLPVDAQVPSSSGTVKIEHDNKQIVLEGRLNKLSLSGRIVIPLNNIDQTRLEIDKDKFAFSIGAAVSISPFIAGAKPNFANADLTFVNATDVIVGKTNKGILLASTDVLVLGQPIIQIGDGSIKAQAAIDLTADGGAKLFYDLSKSHTLIAKAKFRVKDFSFGLIGPIPRVLDINGDQLVNPQVKLEQLLIEIDQLGLVKFERGSLKNLRITAEGLSKAHRSTDGKGMAYSGKLSGPFAIDTITAGQVKIGDEVFLGALEITNGRFALMNSDVDMGDGMSFTNANMSLSFDKINQINLAGQTQNIWSNANLSVDGLLSAKPADYAVNEDVSISLSLSASGPEKALTGVGSLEVSGFTGNARSSLEIGFRCKDTPTLAVPIEYNFGMSGGVFAAEMKDGVLSAQGSINPMAINMHTLGTASCHSPSDKKVIAESQRGWTDGLCTQLFPPKAWPCRWEWSTPEVSFGYNILLEIHFLDIAISMSNPRLFLSDGKMSFCNIGAIGINTPAIVGGFSPQIETPYGGDGEKFVNAIIAASFEAPQSMVATGIINGAGWLASTIGNALCIGKPL